MRILRTVLFAMVLAFAGVQHARAQEPTPQQYESVMRWASAHQQIIQTIVAPLQFMPGALDEGDAAGRAAWVAQARTWMSGYRAELQGARATIERIGPVPEAGELSVPYRRQHEALPGMITSLENFLTQYGRGLDAIENNDPTAWVLAAINATDAQILIMTQFRNINSLQAETMSDGPQRYLLRSFATSYDALIVVLRERRAGIMGERINQTSTAQVRAFAEAMHQNSRQGRVAAQQAEASLPAQVPPEQSDFLRRARLAYQTFGGSFDREDAIANELTSIANLMSGATRFSDIETSVTAHALTAGALDRERGGDIQRRTLLVQTIVPPT